MSTAPQAALQTATGLEAASQFTRQLFDDLKAKHNIPDAPDRFDAEQTLIQRAYVNLGALVAELAARKLDGTTNALPKRLLIYCDVLHIGAANDSEIKGTHLRVFAARVETAGELRIESPGSVTIYCGAMTSLFWIFYREPGGSGHRSQTWMFPGLSVRFDQASGRSLGVFRLSNFGTLREAPETRAALERTYLRASLIYEENAELAIPLLRWVQQATASWAGDMQNLYLQSSALLCSAEETAKSRSFVPWLAKEIYTKETNAFLAAAVRFEENYTAFRSERNSYEERAKFGEVMLRNYQDMEDVAGKLTAQAQANVDDARESVTYYTNQLRDQDLVVARAKIDFDYGLIRYQEEKKLELGLEITSTILSLGAAVAGVAMGVPDMKGLEAINAAIKARTKSAEAAEAMTKLGKASKRLKLVFEALEKIVAASLRIKAIASASIPPLELSDADRAVTDDASWEIFRDKVTDMMDPVIDMGVGGASAYKLSLLALTTYGRALNQSQSQYIDAAHELSTMVLQQAFAARQAQRMAAYVAEMKQGKAPSEELMRWAVARQATVKRWLLLALGNYNQAFRYWALEASGTRADFSQSTGELQEALAGIIRQESGVLQRFRPAPQDFRDCRITISDAPSLEAFRTNRRLSVEVRLENRAFAGYERVRLREVRVWLEGVVSAEPIRLYLSTSGAYADRYKKQNYSFATSWPLEWGFRYDSATKQIQMSAAFADQFRAFYFEPTPFTMWTVRAPDETLNLAGLKSIALEFSGNAIARE